MKTTQAWGWLAAGVLALGLNGIYHDGGAAWAHFAVGRAIDRITARTEPVLALAAGRVDWFAAKTGAIAARNETAACRWATAMARVQTKIARTETGFADVEARTAREEAALARVEVNRARIEAQVERVRFDPAVFDGVKLRIACPRVRVQVPQVRIPQVVVQPPVIHIAGMGSGPV
jgi:hypothetical protein